jgi:hypothetical protein
MMRVEAEDLPYCCKPAPKLDESDDLVIDLKLVSLIGYEDTGSSRTGKRKRKSMFPHIPARCAHKTPNSLRNHHQPPRELRQGLNESVFDDTYYYTQIFNGTLPRRRPTPSIASGGRSLQLPISVPARDMWAPIPILAW